VIGVFGPPNSGKTTLINRILNDIGLEELGKVSPVPHETRKVKSRKGVKLKVGRLTLDFEVMDTPGVSEKIDPDMFSEYGMKGHGASLRTVEAVNGVVESIKAIESVDGALVVVDALADGVDDMTRMLVNNLEFAGKKVLIVVNKMDESSDVSFVQEAFPDYNLILISAKTGWNVEELYKEMIRHF